MLNTRIAENAEFWSDTYGGRSISVFNHHGRWLVYLDLDLPRFGGEVRIFIQGI